MSPNGAERGASPTDPAERLAALPREADVHGGVNPPCEISAVFRVHDAEDLTRMFEGHPGPDEGCYIYGRDCSPSVRHLGRQLAALDGTEAGYATASGMSAISCALLSACDTGDHIVASNTLYGGTFALLSQFFPKKMNIITTFVDVDDAAAVKSAIRPNTKVHICTGRVQIIQHAFACMAISVLIPRRRCSELQSDNTFASLIVSPAHWGADVVVQSLTKYVSGGADLMAGSVCSTRAFINKLMDMQKGPHMMLGPTLDPRTATELSMRLPHLALRLAEHSRRALAFAERLQQEGVRVVYPGLKSHPHHERLNSQRNAGPYGHSGMLTIDLGSYAAGVKFMESAQNEQDFGLIAVSLGYHDTLMCASASSTSSGLTEDERQTAGITPGLVRISVGITGTIEQRMAQLLGAVRSSMQGSQGGTA